MPTAGDPSECCGGDPPLHLCPQGTLSIPSASGRPPQPVPSQLPFQASRSHLSHASVPSTPLVHSPVGSRLLNAGSAYSLPAQPSLPHKMPSFLGFNNVPPPPTSSADSSSPPAPKLRAQPSPFPHLHGTSSHGDLFPSRHSPAAQLRLDNGRLRHPSAHLGSLGAPGRAGCTHPKWVLPPTWAPPARGEYRAPPSSHRHGSREQSLLVLLSRCVWQAATACHTVPLPVHAAPCLMQVPCSACTPTLRPSSALKSHQATLYRPPQAQGALPNAQTLAALPAPHGRSLPPIRLSMFCEPTGQAPTSGSVPLTSLESSHPVKSTQT